MNQGVKVGINKLVARIDETRGQAEKEHARAVVAHAKALQTWERAKSDWVGRVRAILEDTLALSDAVIVERAEHDYHRRFALTKDFPKLPEEPVDPGQFDPSPFTKDMKLLGMASDDTIIVRIGDRWGRYL